MGRIRTNWSPEGEIAIVQSVIYLATAPKSNSVYRAQSASIRFAEETGSLSPPKHILNYTTRLMKDIGYGVGYEYDYDSGNGCSDQNYFPEGITNKTLYQPDGRGFEKEIVKRLNYWKKLRNKMSNN